MGFDHVTYAVEGLLRTLEDKLPAKLAEQDLARRAKVVCPIGPYTIPAGGRIAVQGTELGLTAGVRTAAQLRDEINAAVAGVASADSGGRLVFASTVAPTALVPTALRFRKPDAGTDALPALGLRHVWSDRQVLAIASPAPRFLDRDLVSGDIVRQPTVCVERATEVAEDPQRSGSFRVAIRCSVYFPGAGTLKRATREAVSAFVAQMSAVIREGDDRGTGVVGSSQQFPNIFECNVRRLQQETTVWMLGNAKTALPFGRAWPEYDVGLYDA